MSKALELADTLDRHAEHHFDVAQECDTRPCDTRNWEHFEASKRAASELRRLEAVEAAAKNLVKVKGRYHTEQAFNALQDALGETK